MAMSNEFEAFTPEARAFLDDVGQAIRPLFEKHHPKLAYREMEYLVGSEVGILTAELVLRAAVEKSKKPRIPLHSFPACIDFHRFMDELEKKHNFEMRDVAGKFGGPAHDPSMDIDAVEYQDFWHWCLDGPFSELSRGGPNFINAEYLTNPKTPEWARTILRHIFDACEGHPARVSDGIWFYVDW